MAILIKIKKKAPAQEGYVPHLNFSPVTWEYFPLGTPVQVIAQRKSSQGAWKVGSTGVVSGFFPAGQKDAVHPRDDFYVVKLDEPLNPKVLTGHFYHFELERI